MATPEEQAPLELRRRSAMRTAAVLAVVAVAIYAWFIVSNMYL